MLVRPDPCPFARALRGPLRRVPTAACAAVLAAFAAFAGFRAQGGDPKDDGSGALPPRRGLIVFVVDASASMRIRDAGGISEPLSRLEAATRELLGTLAGLRERGEFLFDVVACSSRVEVLSQSLGREGPLPLDAAAEQAAAVFLREARTGGMTRLPAALQEAFEICRRADKSLQPGTILVYTDGIPTYSRSTAGPRTNEEFLAWVKSQNATRVKINAYAVSPSLEGTAFLRRLCAETHGILLTP